MYSLLMGVQTAAGTMKTSMEGFLKLKRRSITDQPITLSGVYPEGLYILLQRSLLIQIHCSYNYNISEMETALMSIS